MLPTSHWVWDGWNAPPPEVLYRLDGQEHRWVGGRWQESDRLLGELIEGGTDWRDLSEAEARALFPGAFMSPA